MRTMLLMFSSVYILTGCPIDEDTVHREEISVGKIKTIHHKKTGSAVTTDKGWEISLQDPLITFPLNADMTLVTYTSKGVIITRELCLKKTCSQLQKTQ